jgi:hypothetical protein
MVMVSTASEAAKPTAETTRGIKADNYSELFMRDPFVKTLLEKNELGTLRRLATSRRSHAVQPGIPTSIILVHISCQMPPGVPGKKEKPVFASEIAILSGATITNPSKVVGQIAPVMRCKWGVLNHHL